MSQNEEISPFLNRCSFFGKRLDAPFWSSTLGWSRHFKKVASQSWKQHFVDLSEKKRVTLLFSWQYVAWSNVLKKQSQSQHCVNIFVWVNTMLLSHQENEKRRKGAKCDIRFFHTTSGYGEARIFVLFSEFTSGKAVKTLTKLVHKFGAHLRILFCVWTFVDVSIIYI